MMEVKLKELVEFMDYNSMVRRHSSAIKGLACEELNLALLCHYLEHEARYKSVIKLKSSCTTTGSRLDAWVQCSNNESSQYPEILYQVEVKSWSFHGYGGGEALPLNGNGTDESYCKHVIARWSKYWNDGSKKFNDPKLNKVLNEMNVPKEFQCQKDNIRTLACLWDAIHPEGLKDPFFEIECSPGKFKAVSIFSVSTYVRNLIAKKTYSLALDLPDTKERISLLSRIFK